MLSFNILAQDQVALRLESRGKLPSDPIGHGTCFIYRGLIITAAHLLDERKIFIEISPDTWLQIKKIIFKDNNLDLAILKAEENLEDTKIPNQDGCYASVKATKIKRYEVSYDGEIKNFEVGGSGAPVYENKKLTGMAQAYRVINKKPVPESVVILPSGVIFRVLDSL